jgi:tRNA (mo5U34)-methyltransferase
MSETFQSLKAQGRRLLEGIGLAPRTAPEPERNRLDDLRDACPAFRERLLALKAGDPDIRWYPHDSLANIEVHLDRLADGGSRRVLNGVERMRIADIGAADGDVAFFLESVGAKVDIIDNAPTNMNALRGARRMKELLGSSVAIHDVDLDSQFHLPGEYDFAVFLGILYHLKNPYYAMEQLGRRVRAAFLSTRVTQFDRPADEPGAQDISGKPLAYLVGPDECNGDATNYWMFTNAGLRRMVDRCGWDVVEYKTAGAVGRSDPWSADGDERAFVLLESRWFK